MVELELNELDYGFLKLCFEFVLCKLNFQSSGSVSFHFTINLIETFIDF